jgi:17beta-estradiol 17-dehydrogenase / very-long-chain 3-oxoacyl-CoA reductase
VKTLSISILGKKHEAVLIKRKKRNTMLKDSLLVNNVGIAHEAPIDFVEEDEKTHQDIITVNIAATIKMTAMILPTMLKR